jgi:hypothetical protein
MERLRVRVSTDEINTRNILPHHVLNSVTAASTHSDDFDNRTLWLAIYKFKHYQPSQVLLHYLQALELLFYIKINVHQYRFQHQIFSCCY